MPNNQTVSHSQSFFGQKNHFYFLALVESKIESIAFKNVYNFRATMKITKMAKIVYRKCLLLGNYPNKFPPPPRAKATMQKRQIGGKFLYWYQEFLCPVEPLYFSDEKSITVEK